MCSDFGLRGAKKIPLKKVVDDAILLLKVRPPHT